MENGTGSSLSARLTVDLKNTLGIDVTTEPGKSEKSTTWT